MRRRLRWSPVPISTVATSKARIWPRSMPAPPPDRRFPGLGRWTVGRIHDSAIPRGIWRFEFVSAEASFELEPGSDLNSRDVEGGDWAPLDAGAASRPAVSRARSMDRRSNPRFGDPARNLALRIGLSRRRPHDAKADIKPGWAPRWGLSRFGRGIPSDAGSSRWQASEFRLHLKITNRRGNQIVRGRIFRSTARMRITLTI